MTVLPQFAQSQFAQSLNLSLNLPNPNPNWDWAKWEDTTMTD